MTPPNPATLPRPVGRAFSHLGERIGTGTGIGALMDDLGAALTGDPGMRMLGGGNPALVPEVAALLKESLEGFAAEPSAWLSMLGNYDPPRGNPAFLEALAARFRESLGWPVSPDHLAVTAGGQAAFFALFNLLGGTAPDGRRRRILLPLAPEYIGYADQGLEPGLFGACRPAVERSDPADPRTFKYRIDFAAVDAALAAGDIAAIAVSRPTNPSGNVITDAEVRRLSDAAARSGIPLILDGAYGHPFPGIAFTDAHPFWAPHVILTLSLSKLGLPGIRTGIVVGPPEVVRRISAFTAVTGLANNNVGQRIVLPWIRDGRLLEIGPRWLRPYYDERRRSATAIARAALDRAGVDAALHRSEGAFFHWLWLPSLRIPSRELYVRLKERRVLVVPGEHFFFGLDEPWDHSRQCLRVSYAQPDAVLEDAWRILAETAGEAGRGRVRARPKRSEHGQSGKGGTP